MGSVSPWQIILLLVVALLLFGAKRLPEIGRSLGTGMREFKDSVTGKDEEPAQLPPAQAAPPPVATPAAQQQTPAPPPEQQ
jgi:sec-independent protein translocase protein TatA